MKVCYNCGAQLEDSVEFCPYCGAMFSNQGYVNQGYANQGYANQGYMNQGYMNQGYSYQEYPDSVPQSAPKKKRSKKPLIITFSVLFVVALLCVGAYFLFFAGKLSKKKAEKIINSYIASVERLDVEGVFKKTVPKNLVNRILHMSGEFDGYGYDDLIDELNDEMDDAVGGIKIDIKNVKIIDVKEFDFYEYIEQMDALIRDGMAQYGDGEDFSIEQIIEETSDGEKTIDDAYRMFQDAMAVCGIDMKDIYIVDLSFRMDLSAYGETISYDNEDIFMNHVIIYKYEDEWYVLPGLEGAVAPALIRYMQKSKMSMDISSAKTIRVAIETAMANESFYEELTGEHADELIMVTENGLRVLSDSCAGEIKANIGDSFPEVKYRKNGAENFAFQITANGCVYVYTVATDGKMWELTPELSFDYQ